MAIQVAKAFEQDNGAAGSSAYTQLSFWDVEGGQLQQLMSLRTGESEESAEGSSETHYTVTFEGALPHDIVVNTTTKERSVGADMQSHTNESHSTLRRCFSKNAYQACGQGK